MNSQQQQNIKVSDVPITNQNEALQMLVYFINVSQKRGTFTIDESAKIYECIKMFQSSMDPRQVEQG
jgi:hypothetical protein